MGAYSLSVRTISTAPLTAVWELRTAANVPALVYEIGLNTGGASSGQNFVLARATIQGDTPSTSTTVLADDGNAPAGNTVVATAWTNFPPPLPTTPGMLRRIQINVTTGIGSGIIWTFPRGLLVPASSSLALWNINTGSVMDMWVSLDE